MIETRPQKIKWRKAIEACIDVNEKSTVGDALIASYQMVMTHAKAERAKNIDFDFWNDLLAKTSMAFVDICMDEEQL